ncbi:MAG: glutamate formimidoyltransferase [Nitrospirales bacterium]
MTRLVECVPNVSEGQDLKVIDALAKSVGEIGDVALLDRHIDGDHHRTVFTMVGAPDATLQAAYELVRQAIPLINLSIHKGGHPRVGAVDVVPFIPLQGMAMDDCRELANQLGEKIGSELEIPSFLYGEASPLIPKRQLEMIRRGGWNGLSQRMASDSQWRPDFGPPHLHLTAGAVVVGARNFLIAYNIVLQSMDLVLAQVIAKTIRTADGGLPSLKAMGVALHSRGLVQVSMNLTNYHETSIHDAYCAVQREAKQYGVDILESELVGMAPQAAFPLEWIKPLKFQSWSPDQILETQLGRVGHL